MKSRGYAGKQHKLFENKYDGKSYLFHLDEVVFRLKKAKIKYPFYIRDIDLFFTVLKNAGYLHDSMEDTETKEEYIKKHWGEITAKIVVNVTDKTGITRKETKRLTNEKFSKYDINKPEEFGALVLKPIDRLANWSYSIKTKNKKKIKMYFKEYLDFRKSTYRFDIVDDVWQELEELNNWVKQNTNFQQKVST